MMNAFRIITFSLFLCFDSYISASADESTLAKIRNAWATNQKLAVAISCTFVESETHRTMIDEEVRMVSRECEHTVKIDGDKFLYGWNKLSGRPDPHEVESSIVSYNGNSEKSFATFGNSNPSGVESSSSLDAKFKQAILRPIFHAYRPLHPQMGLFDLEHATLIGEKARFGEFDCIILKTVAGRRKNELWVMPGANYLPVRFFSLVDDKQSVSIKIKYKEDSSGLRLAGWKYEAWTADGNLFKSSNCKVTELTLDQPIPSQEFTVTFPENTAVGNLDNLTRREVKTR